jgi:serine phosphatase RsbU (regulator of sigma subunit)
MVVGLFEHTNFDEQTLQLETGDLLVADSDGVTEARNFEGTNLVRSAF